MDFILTLLGCLFVGTIVSLITFAIIHSKNYEKDFNKSWIISTIVIGILLFGLDFLYNSKISETESLKSEIEELKEENSKIKEEKDNLQSQLDDLQSEYNNNKEVNNLLSEQLESYGIEPYEL